MRLPGLLVLLVAAPAAGQVPGFTATRWPQQQETERLFLSVPSADSARAHVRALTTQPHLSGTPGAEATAEWLVDWLRGHGFDTRIDAYDVWLPQPGSVHVEIVGGEVLDSREPAYGIVDPESPELLSWHAYSANGRAEAEVVYANYGLPDDYAELERLGIDVAGRIVLARYGRAYRGVKAAEAEQRGAVGLLLFPDPAGDGYAAGDTLPAGPWRPSRSVQRGTVAYMWKYTGDPLTPGTPSIDGVDRLDPSQATNLPSIPVAPIPYADAARLLGHMEGDAPESFQGALPVSYRTGPGPLRVRLTVSQDYAVRTIRNVVATIPGRSPAYLVIGNHYDAWVKGGVDPHTGTAATLELARGLAALRRTGWQPERGIVIAFWDAEEFGVVGSSEWVEEHIAELRENAIAYFNIDMFTAGTLDVSGAPALRDLVAWAAGEVSDPVTGRPLAALWRERQLATRSDSTEALPRLTDIGAGSDWTAFLHHAGIPSLQWTMNGRGSYGIYHSVLDDAAYYARWADSAFVHTPVVASVMGLAALRLVDADALLFRYSDLALRIDVHLRGAEQRFDVALDTERELVQDMLERARTVEQLQSKAIESADAHMLDRLNAVLPRIEQAFLDPDGLPGRPWYRHLLSAPGRDTGYDAVPLAPLVEALQVRDAAAFERARARLAAALRRAIDLLDGVTR